jgi:hypothetical protein
MAKVKIVKNERDLPLFTSKLLIKFQIILRNTTQLIIRHKVNILLSVISSPITLERQKWKSSKMKGILLFSPVNSWLIFQQLSVYGPVLENSLYGKDLIFYQFVHTIIEDFGDWLFTVYITLFLLLRKDHTHFTTTSMILIVEHICPTYFHNQNITDCSDQKWKRPSSLHR